MSEYTIRTQIWSALNLDNNVEGSTDDAINKAKFYAENADNTKNAIDVKELKDRFYLSKEEFDSI